MSLSPIQDGAVDRLMAFTFDPNSNFIMLSGIAGSGKSYTTAVFVQVLREYIEIDRLSGIHDNKCIYVTSTTNKAREAIQTQFDKLGLNEDIVTIYSFIGARIVNNFRTGKPVMRFSSTPADVAEGIGKNSIIIIDEYSFLGEEAVAFLMEMVGHDPTLKIIFVGDKNQIMPDFGYNADQVIKLIQPEIVMLGKSERAGNPALALAAEQLSQMVEKNGSIDIEVDGKNIVLLERDEFDKKLVEVTKQGNIEFTYLAYNNVNVESYNKLIRDTLNLPSHFVSAEKVITKDLFKFVMNGDTKSIKSETKLTVANSKVNLRPQHSQMSDILEFIKSHCYCPDGNFDTVTFAEFLYKSDITYLVSFEDIDPNLYLNVVKNNTRFNEIMKYFSKNKLWFEYFNAKEFFITLRDVHSTTVHKSQGSTYQQVFVDMENINAVHCPYTRKRLIYVALTRATDSVFITI